MNLELLHLLIKAACADGVVTDVERKFLLKQAEILNVSPENLDFLINSEFEIVISKNLKNALESGFISEPTIINNQSGFIQTDDNTSETLQSGFIIDSQEQLQNQSGFITTSGIQNKNISKEKFTDVTNFPSQGAMSLIQKARLMGKWVIIKRLKPELRTNSIYYELLNKEFENTWHLDHPNIVRVIGKDTDKQGPYYYMEFIDGCKLTELITGKGLLDGRLIKKIVLELLSALEYVHKKQIFHRDLKPDNIIITYKGDNVKLIDFGLAQADSFEDMFKKAGTPKYAAPEQMTKKADVDQRADIYAFGLIFMEMLTGQLENVELIKSRAVSCYFIVKKCIESSPELRFRNCSEIIELVNKLEIKNVVDFIPEKPVKPENEEKINHPKNKFENITIQKHELIQTLKQFFEFTHFVYGTGSIDHLNNPYNNSPKYREIVEEISVYQFILQNCTPNFIRAFEKYFFLRSEYLIHNNNKTLILTNLRIFIKKPNEINFHLILLSTINPENEQIEIEENIYVKFRNYKIWMSDWDLICKAVKLKSWEALETQQFSMLQSQIPEAIQLLKINNPQFDSVPYYLSGLKIPHCTLDEFIQNTHKVWNSSEFTKYYNHRFYDHSAGILSQVNNIKVVFNSFLPLKNEFLLLDCFHNKGIITNYRIFYYDQINQLHQVTSLENVVSYNLADSGVFIRSQKIEILFTNHFSLRLELADNITDTNQLKNGIKRINAIFTRKDWQKLPKENLKLLEYNTVQSNQWWLSENY